MIITIQIWTGIIKKQPLGWGFALELIRCRRRILGSFLQIHFGAVFGRRRRRYRRSCTGGGQQRRGRRQGRSCGSRDGGTTVAGRRRQRVVWASCGRPRWSGRGWNAAGIGGVFQQQLLYLQDVYVLVEAGVWIGAGGNPRSVTTASPVTSTSSVRRTSDRTSQPCCRTVKSRRMMMVQQMLLVVLSLTLTLTLMIVVVMMQMMMIRLNRRSTSTRF